MTSAASGIPQVLFARVLAGGGPYREHEVLSIAFVDASLARLLAHSQAGDDWPDRNGHERSGDDCFHTIPETIVVEVLTGAGPHTKDDRLVLSFVDPQVARVVTGVDPTLKPKASLSLAPGDQTATTRPISDRVLAPRAILLFERWNEHEARRFIAVVDKLFTVERLGWHRHALAMRLLLPDNLVLGSLQSSHDVLSQLESLRAAAAEALNAPLLAAFMPHFSADATWLASLETPALLAAAATLHDLIERQGGVEFEAPRNTPELIGSIAPEEWASWRSAGTNAFLALLLPNRARHPAVAQRLTDYRSALLELLGQMAQAPPAVQSSQMAQSNPVLDDRLWNLAGAFQDAWGVNPAV